ncbi:MAG: glycosyl hydrolase family 17 [Cyclobacteriaceae bacterium]|nr:glycosyl hydrolase family 17 [Cyclobacteriaceae bacterium]
MKSILKFSLLCFIFLLHISCGSKNNTIQSNSTSANLKTVTAKDILGNPAYQAICYEGYREKTRSIQPTVAQLQEDLRILHAMDIRIVRTYNVQLAHASTLLKAIQELKQQDPTFEMYVMLGAWIDCQNAWTDKAPNHDVESEQNEGEIARAVALANQYPDIVKIIAVGNEAMVKWATSYYVQPAVILKWVKHLQNLKAEGKLSKDLWITSSDDFASWGGGDASYHTPELTELMKAVDYISMHTYPYHNTHYNPDFWKVPSTESTLPEIEKVDAAMLRARDFAKTQYENVKKYMASVGVNKPIHIGETGWASTSDGFYGAEGSRATDEYKQGKYYQLMREWTNAAGISCFYFEAFDEQWKDAANPMGSENHFGLFNLKGEAKFGLWNLVDAGLFKGLNRGGNSIVKTEQGQTDKIMKTVLPPPAK